MEYFLRRLPTTVWMELRLGDIDWGWLVCMGSWRYISGVADLDWGRGGGRVGYGTFLEIGVGALYPLPTMLEFIVEVDNKFHDNLEFVLMITV